MVGIQKKSKFEKFKFEKCSNPKKNVQNLKWFKSEKCSRF
jgi:hypothetical protein